MRSIIAVCCMTIILATSAHAQCGGGLERWQLKQQRQAMALNAQQVGNKVAACRNYEAYLNLLKDDLEEMGSCGTEVVQLQLQDLIDTVIGTMLDLKCGQHSKIEEELELKIDQ